MSRKLTPALVQALDDAREIRSPIANRRIDTATPRVRAENRGDHLRSREGLEQSRAPGDQCPISEQGRYQEGKSRFKELKGELGLPGTVRAHRNESSRRVRSSGTGARGTAHRHSVV